MTTPNKTLLLLETKMSGHRPSYLRRMIEMAHKNNMDVVIAMPDSCFQHPVILKLLESFDKTIVSTIHCKQLVNNTQSKNPLGMLRREYQCARFYNEALSTAKQERQIDAILIATFDDAATISGILLPKFKDTPWLGIVMKQRFHYSVSGLVGPPASKQIALKRYFFFRLLKKLKPHSKILTIDESLNNHIATRYPDLKDRIDYIPDPVDDRQQITNPDLRKELGIPENVFVILAYGSLRKRKGVPPLLETLHKLPEHIHVVLAGNQEPDIEALVNSDQHKDLLNSGRMHQINRYIDVSEDANLFSMADSVWIAYEDYYQMSAAMVQAAQYERPTIAAKTGQIGYLTNKYQTGLVVDTKEISQLCDAVNKLVNKEFNPTTENYNAFSKDFSLSAFEEALVCSINEVCSK